MALTQVTSIGLKDGEIVNADLHSAAAIALSKLSTSGTAGSGNYLRGDGAWTAIDLTALSASNLTSGTVAAARLDTATTQSAGNSSTKIATTAFVSTAVTNLIGGAPGALDTLNELAAAINDDSSYASTVTTALATKAVLSGSTNNTICTVTGANAIQGEANLTFDGTHLNLGNTGSNWVGPLNVGTGASGAAQVIDIYSNSDTYGGLWFSDGTSGADRYVGAIQYHHDSNYMKFDTNGAERVRIQSDGHVKINDGDLVIGTAGHGIDFSAQTATSASGASTTSELLDHYEEGTFTPYIRTSGDSTEPSYAGQYGIYSRVGDIVQFSIWVKANSTIASSSGSLWIAGLPFTAQSMTGSWQGSTVLQYYHNVANINSSATSISAIGPNSGGTVISFNWLSAGAWEATLAGNNIQANTELIFGGTYKAA